MVKVELRCTNPAWNIKPRVCLIQAADLTAAKQRFADARGISGCAVAVKFL